MDSNDAAPCAARNTSIGSWPGPGMASSPNAGPGPGRRAPIWYFPLARHQDLVPPLCFFQPLSTDLRA
jgi:hypothetical protein